MLSSLHVRDLMLSVDQIPTVLEDEIFRVALEMLNSRKLGVVCILSAAKQLKGIITDGDIRRIILKTQKPLPQLFMESAQSLATLHPVTVSNSATLLDAISIISSHRIWVLPVVTEENELIGLVHLQWVLKVLADEMKK